MLTDLGSLQLLNGNPKAPGPGSEIDFNVSVSNHAPARSLMTHTRTLIVVTIALACGARPCGAQEPKPAFEGPPTLKASEILEPTLLKSPLYKVAEEVSTYGFANGYVLKSKYGSQHVRGTAMLRVRVQEIKALAEIEKAKGTKEFVNALARAAKSPLLATKNLITNPVNTVSGVPRGAWRVLVRAGEGIRGKTKRSEFEDRRIRSLIGFSLVKRQLAFRLRVDPYTSNKHLQRELNSLAWAGYAGKMTVTAALVGVGGAAANSVQGLKTAEEFAELIRDSNPIDLQKSNRKKLRGMGVTKPIYEAFLNNPWYSPTTGTGLVLLLDKIGPASGKELFVKLSATAEAEEGALFYMQTARLIARYHEKVAKVAGIADFHGMPVCYDEEGTLVVPFYWDYGAWTEGGANAVEGLRVFQVRGKPPSGIHLYMSGEMTERVRRELADREITLTEDVFGRNARAIEVSPKR